MGASNTETSPQSSGNFEARNNDNLCSYGKAEYLKFQTYNVSLSFRPLFFENWSHKQEH